MKLTLECLNKTLFCTRWVLESMSGEVEIRHEDMVAQEAFSDIKDLYAKEDWSRFVPEEFQSDGYKPNRLLATEGFNGNTKLNISCYKDVESSKFFLGIIGHSTPSGSVEIEAFLAEVPEDAVVQMQYEEHGKPNRRTLNERSIDADGKDSLTVISESVSAVRNICRELENKSVEELILDT